MKSSAEKERYSFGCTRAEFLNSSIYLFSQIAKFKNLATSKKFPNLCVCKCSRYFLYTLLSLVLSAQFGFYNPYPNGFLPVIPSFNSVGNFQISNSIGQSVLYPSLAGINSNLLDLKSSFLNRAIIF